MTVIDAMLTDFGSKNGVDCRGAFLFVSPWRLLYTVFIGLDLLHSAFIGFYQPEMIFKKIGLNRSFILKRALILFGGPFLRL